MADPMRIRAVDNGGHVEVKVLVSHVMETGNRKDADGKLVPAHFIEKITATCCGRTVLAAEWGPSVAKNPYLAFRFKGPAKGEKLTVTWTDTAGETRTDEVTVG